MHTALDTASIPATALSHHTALQTIAMIQQSGGVCAFIDGTGFDAAEAKAHGVDLGNLLVSQPDCEEQAELVESQLKRCGAVDLIIRRMPGELRAWFAL